MFQNQFSQVLRKVSRYPRNFSTQRTLSPRKIRLSTIGTCVARHKN